MRTPRSTNSARICLVTSVPISYNPRIVKEADALHEAGYCVSVVSPLTDEEKTRFDESVVSVRSWRWRPVDVRRRPLRPYCRWLARGLASRALRMLPGVAQSDRLRDHAYSRYVGSLAAEAERDRAALYIAHNLPALPAAARAALRTGARLGFDAEDFHRGQFTAADRAVRRGDFDLTVAIEKRYIPTAHHVTAASDGIGRAYARELGIPEPVTVLNAFPLTDRNAGLSRASYAEERRGDGLSLYWYSQVIGPDRGLTDALEAVAKLDGVQLHLRGLLASSYERALMARIRNLGLGDRIHLHRPVPPGELVQRAAQHDVGLALEVPDSANRDLCVSNKILAYFLAGLVVAATDTEGQREIMKRAKGAGFLYASGDTQALADGLRMLRDDPRRLALAKERARQAAEEQFCWELESPKLLRAIAQTLDGYRAWNPQHGAKHHA